MDEHWLVWRTNAAGEVIYWRRDDEAGARAAMESATASLARAGLEGRVEAARGLEPEPGWIEAPMDPTP